MLLCLSDKDNDYIYFAFNGDLQVNFLNHHRIWKSCKNLEGTYDIKVFNAGTVTGCPFYIIRAVN